MKDGSCTGEASWTTIQVHMQHWRNKDRALRKRRLRKWWTLLWAKKKWRTFHSCWKIFKSECPEMWIRLLRHKRPKSWSNIESPVVLAERNFHGYPLADFLWEKQLEDILLGFGSEKVPIENAYLFIGKKDHSNQFQWMTWNWLEESRIWFPCWKIDETCGSWKTNIVSWPRSVGMHSPWM